MENNKYNNSKIYKIVDIGYNEMYIGSTTKKLTERMANHRCSYRANKNVGAIKILFDKYGVENCKIELIENFPCNNKEELHKKEGEHIKNNNCVNKNIAGRTKKEYIKELKEKNNYIISPEKNKEYYLNFKNKNKDKLKEKKICPICNGNYNYYSKSVHLKTMKHQKAENLLNENNVEMDKIENININLKEILNKKIEELKEQLNKIN